MDEGLGAAERLARGTPLGSALDTTDPASWVALDAEVRTPGSRIADSLPTRHRLRSLPPGPPSPVEEPLIALALCHPNGRVRSAALERAAGSPQLRPLLVIRCADWAGPVRDRAQALLADVPGTELIALSGLILFLRRRDRGGFAFTLLEGALRKGPDADVRALLTSGDREVRRFGHGLAIDRRLLTAAELARTAVGATDDVRLQILCAEAALARTDGCDHEEVVVPLLSARSAMVRSAGVTGLRRTGRHEKAVPHLADRSAMVRACARYVLRQAGIDPLPLYRSMCAEPAARPPAAAGLGECGGPPEADTLCALTAHPLASVRAHAVSGLRALDAVRSERVEPLLDDPVPAVVRAAARALRPYAAGLDEDRLRARLAPDRLPATRKAARLLLDAQLLARERGHSGL